jgi:phosphoribosylformylglycinamidine synthase
LAESCISQQIARETPRLIGAQVDLSALIPKAGTAPESSPAGGRLDALLFGESQARIVITATSLYAVKVVERVKLLGVAAVRIGTVGGDYLAIKSGTLESSWAVAELYDLWWNAIARAMR